jgi:hypothetical protein
MIDNSNELTIGELDAVNGGSGLMGLMGGDGIMGIINQIKQTLQAQQVLDSAGHQQG